MTAWMSSSGKPGRTRITCSDDRASEELSMPVTDLQAEILHDLLSDDYEAAQRAVERGENLGGMGALMETTFAMAACRAFAFGWTMPQLVQFVARVRIERQGVPLPFTALDAEEELRRVLGDTVPPTRDIHAAGVAQMSMLRTLVDDLGLSNAGLNDLISRARADADRILDRTAP